MSKRRIESEIRPESLEARYANYFEVGHNAVEFIFECGQYHLEDAEARMHSRIVTHPVYAKLLAELLRAAVQQFEKEHGPIQPVGDDLDPIEIVNQSIESYDHRFNNLRKQMAKRSEEPDRNV